ncbi:hypothetical protein DV737_g2671, partial [Chaetothyriales sp. CBS 132003]
MSKPIAIITGAGIAGLATAWWLDKAGWQSIVVERAESFRAGGYVVSVAGLGYETIKHMDLLDEVKSVAHSYDDNIIKDNNGKELCRIRYGKVYGGLEALAIRRDGLAWTLAKIRTLLAGGDAIEVDLLIGADGFRSEIRKQLFKDGDNNHLEPLGYYYSAHNFEGQVENEKNFGSMTGMHVWREDGSLSAKESQDQFEILHGITAKAVPQVHEAVEQAEKAGALVNMDSLTLVNLPQWSKGRVVLFGDAAHCLTLLSGQGAGIALTSSEILGKELQKTSDVPQALRNHESKLRPAIERLQARSE